MRDRGNDETGPEMGHVRLGKPNNLLHTELKTIEERIQTKKDCLDFARLFVLMVESRRASLVFDDSNYNMFVRLFYASLEQFLVSDRTYIVYHED